MSEHERLDAWLDSELIQVGEQLNSPLPPESTKERTHGLVTRVGLRELSVCANFSGLVAIMKAWASAAQLALGSSGHLGVDAVEGMVGRHAA
jgi:hypothetical protein